MDRLSSPLLLLFANLTARASPVLARADWGRHFAARGVEGAFVLFEPLRDRYQVFDESRARQRFLPASTFEVASALIGLETGAIADEREVFAWDGKPRLRRAWEADQTLASGVRESTVWMFQEVARRVGKARMREWVERLEYGNRDIAGGIDLFWLQGSLRISAFEQVDFLYRLSEGRLAATQRAQRLVRAAMVVEKTRAHTLYAKAGATGQGRGREPPSPYPVAWWIGWIERRGRPAACFALNCRPAAATPSAACLDIARAILAEEGML